MVRVSKVYAGSAGEGGRIDTVFFTSSEELTDDSNTGSADQGNDLYAYSLGTGRLSDLTPDGNPEDPNGASVISFVGSAPRTGRSSTSRPSGALAAGASAGQSNLYVYDAASGRTTFIAPRRRRGRPTGGTPALAGEISSEVTPDGRHLVFGSSENLTAYNQEGHQ